MPDADESTDDFTEEAFDARECSLKRKRPTHPEGCMGRVYLSYAGAERDRFAQLPAGERNSRPPLLAVGAAGAAGGVGVAGAAGGSVAGAGGASTAAGAA